MSLLDPCVYCGCSAGAHFTHCAMVSQTSQTVPAPQPTAYDRAQAELERRITALEHRIENSLKMCAASDHFHKDRLDAALRRIEQLELEVARLQQSALNPMMVLQPLENPACSSCGSRGGHASDCHALHVKLYTEAMTGQEAQQKARAYAQAVDQKMKNIAASLGVVMECAGIELPDEGT